MNFRDFADKPYERARFDELRMTRNPSLTHWGRRFRTIRSPTGRIARTSTAVCPNCAALIARELATREVVPDDCLSTRNGICLKADEVTPTIAKVSKHSKGPLIPPGKHAFSAPAGPKPVASLLDSMVDGNEYGSIVSLQVGSGVDLLNDVVRSLDAISALRGRPCLADVGNLVRQDDGGSGIDTSDDLPFHEMVSLVPAGISSVDVLVATRGGSAHQTNRFVAALRSRFSDVSFLVPSYCMSAGTLFVLSGDSIWMTQRACLGPIDPQVPSRDGRYVPAQALVALVKDLQRQGDEATAKSLPVPWSAIRIIDSMDKKELGDALSATQYSQSMAAQFLTQYKLRSWTVKETSRTAVTPAEREARASEIASDLVSHERWKAHGHAISRDVLWSEIRLRIDHPDAQLERALARSWALFNYLFDKTIILKCIVSAQYRYVRTQAMPATKP